MFLYKCLFSDLNTKAEEADYLIDSVIKVINLYFSPDLFAKLGN